LWKTRIREDLIFLIERGALIGNVDATLMDGEHRKSICAILRNAARYETPPAKIFVEIKPIFMRSLRKRSWIAYNESEQTVGFYTMMEHSLALPFVTEILGIKVAVEQIDMNEHNAFVAVCRHDSKWQRIPILDLPLPSPTPRGAEWIAAYRYWRTGRT
jgi:hypothetical protein